MTVVSFHDFMTDYEISGCSTSSPQHLVLLAIEVLAILVSDISFLALICISLSPNDVEYISHYAYWPFI